MTETSESFEDRLSSEALVDSYAAAGQALLDSEEAADSGQKEWTGARCNKCGAPQASDVVSICRRCGWYASLNAYVEVDPNWEPDTEAAPAAAEAPRPSHLRVWINMLPRWGWIIIASVLLVIVESVAVRLATPADSFIRTTWSLSQLAIGVIAVVGCHIFNFLVLAADDAEIGLLDLLLKPLKLWIKAVHNLPTRLWVVDAAASGLVAAVMSIVVIGGIPYERLWDWGIKEPPKQNLMGAVMDRVKKLESRDGNDDLEGAIGDFAGSQDVDPDAAKQSPPKPRNRTDCVILGYRLDRDGRLTTLLLGIANRGELVYAGNVTPKLPGEEMIALTNMLKQIEARQPFIRVEAEATWVEAKYTCRVMFSQRTKEGRLRDIEWDKMLGKIERK